MKPLQALRALFTCAFLPLQAASLDDLTYTTTNGEVTITDCDTAATGELVIPNTIDGHPVTSIGEEAFQNCTSLTSITIPDSVTSIGSEAFIFCSSLPSITIPDSVTSIEDYAFAHCSSLTSITIPDGVTSIATAAFQDCTSLTSITIPDSVTSIGIKAFYECSSLTSITIPDGVTSIGDSAFEGCTNLTSITIPDSVTSIGNNAFQRCISLTSILPVNFQLINGYLIGPNSDLSGADLSGADLSGADLSGVDLSGADLSGADLSNANLNDIKVSNTIFIGAVLDNITTNNQLLLNMSVIGSNTERINQMENQLAILINALAQKDAVIEEQNVQLAQIMTERDSAITERDARPTQAAYDAAVATARTAGQGDVTGDPASYSLFTEDQINAMTTDPTIGRNAAGNMQVDISFIHSTDLQTFTPFAVSPDWVSVVDGKIALEFPPSDENTFFYRLGVQ